LRHITVINYIQNFIQHPSVIFLQKKLLGIISIMDFEATVQQLIIYAALIKYLRKCGNTMWQCIS